VPRPRREEGFTLIEVTMILLVLAVLSAIMLPQMGSFNRLARFVRAREDIAAICSVLKVMLDDVGAGAVYADRRDSRRLREPVGLLVGEGDTPLGTAAAGTSSWQLRRGSTFTVPTDGGSMEPEFRVDTLANHLIGNVPLGDGERRWPTALDSRRGRNAQFQWRGPYLDAVATDPWGNRYMVNTFALHSPPEGGAFDHYGTGVVCMSAGPDEAVSTAFNQPVGWRTGGDDMTALLHAGGAM